MWSINRRKNDVMSRNTRSEESPASCSLMSIWCCATWLCFRCTLIVLINPDFEKEKIEIRLGIRIEHSNHVFKNQFSIWAFGNNLFQYFHRHNMAIDARSVYLLKITQKPLPTTWNVYENFWNSKKEIAT